MKDDVEQKAREIVAQVAEELGYCDEDIEAYRTGPLDGDELLPVRAVERAMHAATEIEALRERVRELDKASGEAVALIDEINERKLSRGFNGINQVLHAKLCTIRATLARQSLNKGSSDE